MAKDFKKGLLKTKIVFQIFLRNPYSKSKVGKFFLLTTNGKIVLNGFIHHDNGTRYLQKDHKSKSGWKAYEIEIGSEQFLEEVLNRECQSFEVDQGLVMRLNEIREKYKDIIDRISEDIKINGLYYWRPKQSIEKSGD